MTVRELKIRLNEFDDKDNVIISHPVGGVYELLYDKNISSGKGCIYLVKEYDDDENSDGEENVGGLFE